MKKIIFFITFIALITTGSLSYAEEPLYINGNEWQKYTTSTKVAFIMGWVKSGKESIDNLPIILSKWNESIEYTNLAQETFVGRGILLGGLSIGQIVETIDQIYTDPRTKTLDIVEIMPLVNGRLKLGWTLTDLDIVIAVTAKLYHCEKHYGNLAKECSSIRQDKNNTLEKLNKK